MDNQVDNLADLKQHTSDTLQPMLQHLPDWLPMATRAYLVHTEGGASIRAVARAIGSHPSTIMRQVRKVEVRRDDPLLDKGLETMGACLTAKGDVMSNLKHDFLTQSDVVITPQMIRTLVTLAHRGTVLALARDLDNAVIVRDGPDGSTERLSVVDRKLAMAMAMMDWITPDDPENRIVRYRLSPVGRVALREHAPKDTKDSAVETEMSHYRRVRYGAVETPLSQLSRRKGAGGDPFLKRSLVDAGNRLREDYELAMMDDNRPEDWTGYIFPSRPVPTRAETPAENAHIRVAAALTALGPGLGDVALTCCCQLDGLEKAEKTLGWAARSGKIVLRIALTHLVQHYAAKGGDTMIG
ncbi:MAG: DUF6456 domain-containing protein [Planktomarina sp.]